MPRVSSDELVYGDGVHIKSVVWPAGGSERTALETMRTLHAVKGDPSRVRFNDAKCDRRGRLFAGTMDLDEAHIDPTRSSGIGALYSVDPFALRDSGDTSSSVTALEPDFRNGNLNLIDEPVFISNGITWSLDDRLLYFVDSIPRTISVFDYNAVTCEACTGWFVYCRYYILRYE